MAVEPRANKRRKLFLEPTHCALPRPETNWVTVLSTSGAEDLQLQLDAWSNYDIYWEESHFWVLLDEGWYSPQTGWWSGN